MQTIPGVCSREEGGTGRCILGSSVRRSQWCAARRAARAAGQALTWRRASSDLDSRGRHRFFALNLGESPTRAHVAVTDVCHDSTNIICRPSPRPNCTHVFRSCVYVACRDACRSRITSTRRSRITASTSTSTRSSFLPCCAPNVHSTLASATSSSRWARQVWRCARAC